jgi:hypothetical protein
VPGHSRLSPPSAHVHPPEGSVAIALATMSDLAALVAPVRTVLLDRDGPLCHVFGARAAARTTDGLRALLATRPDPDTALVITQLVPSGI